MQILIVDTDAFFGEALREFLRLEGHQCHHVETSEAAVAALLQSPVDLMVMDHGMPEVDGRTLSAFVAACYPTVRQIVFLGHGRPAARQAQHAVAQFEKPVDMDRFLQVVQQLAAGASPIETSEAEGPIAAPGALGLGAAWPERRLSAVLSADVVGYSRLMGMDDVGTLQDLSECLHIFDAIVARYRGRIVNSPGDAVLAEFQSVTNAVLCAVEIQREIGARNAPLPPERRMVYRIGVNLGDVLVKDGAIYGDGVNIAARLEAMCDGAGVCISGTVFDQVESRLGLHCRYLGRHRVKNIRNPVRAYRIEQHKPVPGRYPSSAKVMPRWPADPLPILLAIVIAIALLGAGLMLGWFGPIGNATGQAGRGAPQGDGSGQAVQLSQSRLGAAPRPQAHRTSALR